MSTKVGIISDTHNLVRPEVLKVLRKCDYVLHAGDFTEPRVLDQMQFPGKFYAVRGNCDGYWAHKLAPIQRFRIEELEFLLVHDRGTVHSMAKEADVVVFGHTHRFTEEYVRKEGGADGDVRLWLNPGSCGYPRFGGKVSMAVMEIDGRDYRIRKIDLS